MPARSAPACSKLSIVNPIVIAIGLGAWLLMPAQELLCGDGGVCGGCHLQGVPH
jgi:hypothetical protein